MESLINLLGFATDGSAIGSKLDNMFEISNTSMLLILALVFLGTNLVSNITSRNTPLNYITPFCGLLIGALLANSSFSEIEFPVHSDLAQTAISANFGMMIASLLILAIYGRAGFINK